MPWPSGLDSSSLSHALFTDTPLTDLTELELPDTMKTHFPDPADLLNFELTITPDEGQLRLTYIPLRDR